MLQKFKRESLDLLEIFIIPSISIFLPWSITIKIFDLVARCPFLYAECMPEIINGAKSINLFKNEKDWIKFCKISRIIDYADIFLCLTRGERYFKKYVRHNFSEQLLNQNIIFFPHYGMGLWLYKYLSINGVKSNLLSNPISDGLSVKNLSYKLRMFVLTKHCSTNIIMPTSMLEIRKVLKNKETILVSPDMPKQEGVKYYMPETELGMLNVTASFFDLAESRGIPVVNMILGYDEKSGVREFDADFLGDMSGQEYAEKFAIKTINAIKLRPHLWRMLVMVSAVLVN